MMKNIGITIGLILLSISGMYAQNLDNDFFSVDIGYQNLNGNYGTAGISWLKPTQNDNALKFSALANMGSMKGQFILIPEAEIAYLFFLKKEKTQGRIDFPLAFYKVGTSVTPYAVQPKIGISILTFWDIELGYSFQFQEHDYTTFEGVFFGTRINIPTFLSLQK